MQYILIADDNHDITDVLSTYSKRKGWNRYWPMTEKKLCVCLISIIRQLYC